MSDLQHPGGGEAGDGGDDGVAERGDLRLGVGGGYAYHAGAREASGFQSLHGVFEYVASAYVAAYCGGGFEVSFGIGLGVCHHVAGDNGVDVGAHFGMPAEEEVHLHVVAAGEYGYGYASRMERFEQVDGARVEGIVHDVFVVVDGCAHFLAHFLGEAGEN